MTEAPLSFYGCAREHQKLRDEILDQTADVLCRGQALQGPEVECLEQQIAAASKRSYGVGVGSGTDALFFALLAVGIRPGDEVLVADLTFLASATAILRAGARPVFVDVDEACNLDLEKAEDAVSAQTRAIVFVHLFGGMSDPAKVESFAKRHDIAVVEDYAQALGARFGARPAGSLGAVSATSFDPTKAIGAPGSGGAIVTDDADIAAHARRLRLHGREAGCFRELGYNSQLPSLAAAVLTLKLKYHAEWTTNRRAVATRYIDAFEDLPFSYPAWNPQVENIWHKFVLRVDGRDRLAAHLSAAGIKTMIHYATPLHREKIFDCRQPSDRFPVADWHAATALSLPIHSHLKTDEVDTVIEAVRSFYRQ